MNINNMINDILFEIRTPIGFSVHTTKDYWKFIVSFKHPVMEDKLEDVKELLMDPEEIRQSKNDKTVYLFYKLEDPGRWLCAVVKKLNGDGFLITTYPVDKIKEGEVIWNR